MDTKIVKQTETDVIVEVELDKTEWMASLEAAYNKVKQNYTIAGFRKGKAPMKKIEQEYGSDVFYQTGAELSVEKAFDGILKDNPYIKPFMQPQVSIKKTNEEGLILAFNIAFEPKIEITKYTGLNVKEAVKKVTDKEILARLEVKQQEQAREVSVDKPAKTGDSVNIDFKGFLGEVAFEGGEAKGHDVVIGEKKFIPGFEEQIAGHKAGEKFDIFVTFPENYGAPELSGKDAKFEIVLNEVRERVLPKLDDEFASDVSEYNSLEDYKAAIKKELEEQAKKQADTEMGNKIIETIIKNSKFTISNEIIEEELHYAMHDLENFCASQGLGLEQYLGYIGKTAEELTAIKKEEAERMIKMRLVFKHVMEKENIKLEKVDIINKVIENIPSAKLTAEAAEKYFSKLSQERKDQISNEALVAKVIKILVDKN